MTQLNLKQLSLSFGDRDLLDQIDLVVEQGRRIGIMGRNGAGKSTLLKVIAGLITPDSGERILDKRCKLAYLPQEVPLEITHETIFDVVAAGNGEVGDKLKAFHELNHQLEITPDDPALLQRYADIQSEIDSHNGWTIEQQIATQLSRFGLNGNQRFSDLSGGLKRRVLLAKAMLKEPNLLLLDEPTNHLDIAAIEFLENFLLSYSGTTMIISHDRRFLEKTTDTIAEIDRGKIYSYQAGFSRYLELKEARLEEEARHQALFDKRLAQEEAWIRQGIKARRTRNEGRVRALEAMRAEKRAQRKPQGEVRLASQNVALSGKQVIEVIGAHYSYPGELEPIISDFSTLISRGDKVAIIGPNGIGKTTLLKLLLGKITATKGKTKIGTQCDIAYFDQLRDTLDLERSLRDNVGGGSDRITINGKEKHVVGYLQDFLFSPDKIHSPAKVLSGGERNRLLLAKLFTKPANLLVMDEPTNDLDLETLELLEELLTEFNGTLLLVSHDRDFIDRIATHSLVFEGQGKIRNYIGGYSDWLRQRPNHVTWETIAAGHANRAETEEDKTKTAATPPSAPPPPTKLTPQKKLSYKEQRELEQLPSAIEQAEAALAEVQATLADPSFYQTSSPDEISSATQSLETLQQKLEHLYERWEALE